MMVDKPDAQSTAYLTPAVDLAKRLRRLLNSAYNKDNRESGDSCLEGTPMIPLHRATLETITQHLERLGPLEAAQPRDDVREAVEWLAEQQTTQEALEGREGNPWTGTTAKEKLAIIAERKEKRDAAILSARKALSTDSGPTEEQAGKFWLSLREPGMIPERKGPWPRKETAKVLREFIKARPTAYIDYIWIDENGHPYIDHGPEVLQMTDGRSMETGRKHNARVQEAEEQAASDGVRDACMAFSVCLGLRGWSDSPLGDIDDDDFEAAMKAAISRLRTPDERNRALEEALGQVRLLKNANVPLGDVSKGYAHACGDIERAIRNLKGPTQ